MITQSLFSQQKFDIFETECVTKESEILREALSLSSNCNHSSEYWYNNLKYLPNTNDDIIYLKVNFIFLTKPDGTGNFEENNTEHMLDIDGVINKANTVLSNLQNLQNSPCLQNGYISNTKIQILVNKIWKVDPNWDFLESGYIPGNTYSANCALCPPNYNGNYFYNYIDDDPTIPEGINIVFANNGDLYNDMVVDGNYTNYYDGYTGELWAMSEFPTTNNLDRASRIIYPDYFNKYMWMKHVATITYDKPWSTIRYWFRGSGKGLVHELGHSLWLYHDNQCIENIMSQNFNGNYILKTSQIGKMYRTASITNVRQFFTKDSYTHIPIYVSSDETWDLDWRIYSDVVVETGSELRITCKTIMPPQSKIIVQEGASLILEGGIIESANGETWEGIKIEGNGFFQILPDTSVIENNYFYAYVSSYAGRGVSSIEDDLFGLAEKLELIEVKEHESYELKVYPNPSQNNISLSSSFIISKLEIYESNSRKMVLSEIINDKLKVIDIYKFQKGVYLIKIYSKEGKTYYTKFIKY